MITARRRSFARRLLGALRLDASVYEEIEHDAGAVWQAVAVVALGGFAEGLLLLASGVWLGIAAGLVAGFSGWLAATAVVWLIGVRMMGYTSSFPELLRTLGFATAPRILLAIGILPLGPALVVLRLAFAALTLAAFVVAARQALDVDTGRAIVVCVLAAAISVLFGILLGSPRVLG
ncbi:MAG: YIP1 family protein [Myxococcota bacterium]